MDRPSVLVVDDEQPLRAMLTEVLEGEGYNVRTAANGAQALDRLREQRPDVVILDLMMPVLDGWAFMEAYRRVAGAELPIVGASAAMSSEAAHRLRALGVSVCLAKPFDLGELLECVSRLVPPAANTADPA